MCRVLVRYALFVLELLPAVANAYPITLKLAFFSSDRSTTYLASVKPFVDAVNTEGKGLVEIVLYSGGYSQAT
jgi:TRAP-type C4-dicarboxylate transport system substrate-binding protein